MTTLEGHRQKTKERQQRYRERQAEAGQTRVNVMLPADLVAKLDALAAALGITRAAAIEDAVTIWTRPVVPEPVPVPDTVKAKRDVRARD